MPALTLSQADRLPPPPQWKTEPRYLGYRDVDHRRPYAKYFLPQTLPVQPHVRDALMAGMSPTEWGYPAMAAARLMEAPGYLKLETGWTRLEDGTALVCVLTDMPGVTAEMWDWWMAWHSVETPRYKLWYPDAHQFVAWAEDRSGNRALTNRQRYIGNVSFVDEYIGGAMTRLAIHFTDKSHFGFGETPGHTVICGYGSSPLLPLGSGRVLHQVRPTENGCEMRSRFWIAGPLEFHDFPADIYANKMAARLIGVKPIRPLVRPLLERVVAADLPPNFPTDMLFHCASEMNHLASFLPKLYAEFKDDF
jgi:hypothetical protein